MELRLYPTTALIFALSAPPALANPGTRPGKQAQPPGPGPLGPRSLSVDDSRRRAVRGCPVDYDCHGRLEAELRQFEKRSLRPRKRSPWIESDAPGAKSSARFARAKDPSKLRPDLPWLKNIKLPDLPVVWDERVIAYLEFYRNDPRGRRIMSAWLSAQGRYKRLIADELRRANVPRDLLYIAMIESSYDATEYSRSGASGLWQFMPGGGRIYGLTINRWVDERNDQVLSTRAAIRYFEDLYSRFGNWHLALAAYNAGYGAVLRSMAKYNTNDFWKLLDYENGLPWESGIYVPKALATAIVGNNLALFGFDKVQKKREVTWRHVEVPKSVKLSIVARAAGVKVAAIKRLNPQLRRGRTPPGVARYRVRVPAGTENQFATRFPQLRGDWDDANAYVVRHGERFEDIATRHKVSTRALRKLNGIKTEAEVHGGTVLVVPKVSKTAAKQQQHKADDNLYSAGFPRGKAGDKLLVAVPDKSLSIRGKKRVFYRVVSGDSQFDIANAFSVDRQDLAHWNQLDTEAHLHPRMVMQVWVPKKWSAKAAGVKILDKRRLKIVESGSTEHLDQAEKRVGRKRVVHRAKRRESFEDIGKRYGLGKYDLARINRMSPNTVLKKGQEVLVYEVVDAKASDRAKEQAREAARYRRKHNRGRSKKKKKGRQSLKAPVKKKVVAAKTAAKQAKQAKPAAKKQAKPAAKKQVKPAAKKQAKPAAKKQAKPAKAVARASTRKSPPSPPDGPKAEPAP